MSYLPHDDTGRFGWLAAGGGSALLHLAVTGLLLSVSGLALLPAPPSPAVDPDFRITLERFDATLLPALTDPGGLDAQSTAPSAQPPETAAEPETAGGQTPGAQGLPEAEAVAEPAPEPAPELAPEPAPEPAPVAQAEPEPPAEALAALAPEPEPEAEAAPETNPEPDPEPEAQEPETPADNADAQQAAPPEPPLPDTALPDTALPDTALPGQPEGPPELAPEAEPDPAQDLGPADTQIAALPSDLPPGDGAATRFSGGVITPDAAPLPGNGASGLGTSPRLQAALPPQPAADPAAATSGPARVARPARPAAAAPSMTPAVAAPQASGLQDRALAGLIRQVQGARHGPCQIALPRRDGPQGTALALIGADEAAMERLAQEISAEGAAGQIVQSRTLIDPRQCPALSFIRANADYPASRLGLALKDYAVPSGGRLQGIVNGVAGRYVTLLLVDTNGVVQDLGRFTSFSGNVARFDVPVTRPGPPRDTAQMLIALATRAPPNTIRARLGYEAQQVFAGLEGEEAAGAAMAVVTFDLR